MSAVADLHWIDMRCFMFWVLSFWKNCELWVLAESGLNGAEEFLNGELLFSSIVNESWSSTKTCGIVWVSFSITSTWSCCVPDSTFTTSTSPHWTPTSTISFSTFSIISMLFKLKGFSSWLIIYCCCLILRTSFLFKLLSCSIKFLQKSKSCFS